MGLKEFFGDLVPKKHDDEFNHEDEKPLYNPLKIFRLMTPFAWLMYASGFFAWTMDAWDFFSVSLTVPLLAKQFGKDTTDITTSITLTLLFRSLGAVLFGLCGDRYGRKWTLVVNLLLVTVLQIGSGFVETFPQFLAVRSLFGVGMGGIWGQSAATAMENVPVRARGLMSGILQQGYAVGYLCAACVNLTLVETSPSTWRVLFWMGAGLSFAAAVFRACLPESAQFLQARAEVRESIARGEVQEDHKTKAFMRELGVMLRSNWLRCIHAVLLMTGFNFLSHGSQDLYPTYLKSTKGFSAHQATVATIIGNCGAIAGGTIAGYLSQFAGRRLTMICFILLIGAFIPLWIIPSGFSKLSAGAFCVQFGVQGAWGVIPIYLNEISPPAFRGTFPGVAYQLGNMISSAAAQIESTAGKTLRTELNGVSVPDYAAVQGILIGVVAVWTIVMILLGGENHGAHFETAKVGFEDGAGALAPADVRFAAGDFSGDGKAEVEHDEGMVVEKAAGGAKTAA
ncbi:MFS general substrate transporter [Mrakia frigida]|uniref:monocarboxylate/H+ symporter n=1 Tax=Mrakia frigida TaxID=29902 RepID=UPI003FCBF20C